MENGLFFPDNSFVKSTIIFYWSTFSLEPIIISEVIPGS